MDRGTGLGPTVEVTVAGTEPPGSGPLPDIQVLVADPQRHMACIASRCRDEQAAGRHVVFLTANRPYETVIDSLAGQDVRVDAMSFVDAITLANRPPPADTPSNVVFVRSPTMLEMIVMRIEQSMAGGNGPPHVVLDHLNALQLYSGLPMIQQFTHYLVNRLRSAGASADLVVMDTPEGDAIGSAVSGFVDRVKGVVRP